MSMAGGWFVITVNEAFTLNNQIPVAGGWLYMNQAADRLEPFRR